MRDLELHRQAVRLGALGLVFKDKATEVLLQAIAKVQAGEVWLERTMIARVLGEITRARRAPLLTGKGPKSPPSPTASVK